MHHKRLHFIGVLAVLALLLAACGPGVTPSWPGLATDGELVYVTSGQQVFAVSPETQRPVWQFPSAPAGNTGAFVSEPGLGADLVAVGSEGATGTYSGVLFGLDPDGGEQAWCLTFSQRAPENLGCPMANGSATRGLFGLAPAVDTRIIGGITVTNGTVFVGLANGAVYAVDAETGDDLWRFQAERDVWAAPVVGEGVVYVASLDHHVYALDLDSGQVLWQRDMEAAVAGTPTLAEGVLYVGTFGDRLVALDAATGELIWSFDDAQNWIWTGPALFDGTLYFTDVSGVVYALDAETGELVWEPVQPGAQMRARPTVTEELVFVGDREGNLFALDRATGSVRWSAEVEGQLLVAPVVLDDLVVVAPFSGDNLLMAFSAADGTFRWAFAPSE